MPIISGSENLIENGTKDNENGAEHPQLGRFGSVDNILDSVRDKDGSDLTEENDYGYDSGND